MSHRHNASVFDKCSPIFELSLKNFPILTHIMKKYAIVEISTEKKIICNTESINMRIWANKAYCFADVSIITSSWRHNAFYLRLGYWTFSACWISTHNVEYRLRNCTVTKKELANFSSICLNKSSNKNKPVVVFNSFFRYGKLRDSPLTYF